MSNTKSKDLLITLNYDKFIAVYENNNKYYYLGEFSDANKAHTAVHKLGLDNATTIMRANPNDEHDFEMIVKLIESGKERVYDLENIMRTDTEISIKKLEKEVLELQKFLELEDIPFENREVAKDDIEKKTKLAAMLREKMDAEINVEDLRPAKRKHPKPN